MGLLSVLFPRVGRTVVTNYSADQAKQKHKDDANICFWATFVISIILTGFAYHTYVVYKDVANSFGDILVSEPGLTPRPTDAGALVHVAAPAATVRPTAAVGDKDFNLQIYGPFALRREVEYCQWVEHSSTETTKHSDGSETTETTYYYTKGWRPAPVISAFFNQPGAHHNPQRDPYPPGRVDATDVAVGNGFTVDSNLAQEVSVGRESVVPWNTNNYVNFMRSNAYKRNNFYYTNKDGWFYSPYKPSLAESFAKAAVEYMEGSLFDFQIGDIFSECNAGDIRVRFRTKTPAGGVSFIGRQTDKKGRVNTFKSIEDREVDAIYEGLHSAKEIMEMKISDVFSTFMWTAIGSVVSWIVTAFAYRNLSASEEEEQKRKYY